MFRNVLCFRIAKAPNLITLDTFAAKIPKNLVLIFRAGTAKVAQQVHYYRAMDSGHSRDSAKRIAFDQSCDDPCSFFGTQFIHVLNMLERSSIVKQKVVEKL